MLSRPFFLEEAFAKPPRHQPIDGISKASGSVYRCSHINSGLLQKKSVIPVSSRFNILTRRIYLGTDITPDYSPSKLTLVE